MNAAHTARPILALRYVVTCTGSKVNPRVVLDADTTLAQAQDSARWAKKFGAETVKLSREMVEILSAEQVQYQIDCEDAQDCDDLV